MNLLIPLFPLGRIYATAAVASWADQEKIDLSSYLRRHHCGDWGALESEDKAANDHALKHASRILSSYQIGKRKVFFITEADRSKTTVLFADEY